MRGSFFQRHLVEDSFAVKKGWEEQVRAEERGKPGNAEFEAWTRQLEGEGVGGKVNGEVNGEVNGIGKVNGFGDGMGDEGAETGIRLRK